MERYPRLNQHLFHGPLGKHIVDFEEIVCTLVLLRGHGRELVALPVNIEAPHEHSLEEIHAIIAHHRDAPLDQLPQLVHLRRIEKLPRPAMRLLGYLCRASHRVYRTFFGTYGVSPLLMESDDGVVESRPGAPTFALADTSTTFWPASIADHPRVVDGQIVPRKVLTMMLALDHYLVDGHDGFEGIRYLEQILGDPSRLELHAPLAAGRPTSAART